MQRQAGVGRPRQADVSIVNRVGREVGREADKSRQTGASRDKDRQG